MKRYGLFLLLISFLFVSCEKEIVLDLDTAEAKLVVEAIISTDIEPFQVKLSQTTPYFQDGEDFVADALVLITDNLGNADTLTYTGNGLYSTVSNRQGVSGLTYYLNVFWNGKLFSAQETMPVYVNLDTISYVYNEGSTFIEEGYNCAVNAQDPVGQQNFYRFTFFRNDTIMTDPFKYFVVDDEWVEGNYITAYTPFTYQTNDTCKVELLSITKPYYYFLTSLGNQVQASGGPFDPIPSNPPSNISNGGLGFFATAARSVKTIILP